MRLNIFLFLLLIAFVILGCSSSSNVPTVSGLNDIPTSVAPIEMNANSDLIGACKVSLDGSVPSAEFVPIRTSAAIGDAFMAGIVQSGTLGKWFRITGVQLVSHDNVLMKDIIRLDMEFEHPFNINTRPDLCGWDLKAILVYENATPYSFSDFSMTVNPPVLVNSYGETSEFDTEGDLIYPTTANLHQYIVMSEDPSVSDPFDFHEPSGWNVWYPGMVASNHMDIEIDSGSTLDFGILFTLGYEQTSTYGNTVHNPDDPGSRTNPIYNPPNGNNRSPWKVIVSETGGGMISETGSQTTYRVEMWDWQQIDAEYSSWIDSVDISIPGVTSGLDSTIDLTGSGRGSDPVVASITVANDLGADGGDYPALVKVTDNLTGTPLLINGVKPDLKTTFIIAKFDTYKFFMHHIVTFDPIHSDLFDIALAEFGKTRDDLYWDSGPNSFWKASDGDNFFTLWGESLMPDFEYYHRNPMAFPPYVDTYTEVLKNSAENHDYTGILSEVSERLGFPIGSLGYSYTPGASDWLLNAIDSFHTAVGDPLSAGERTTISTDSADIPQSVQIIAARILKGAELAWQLNEDAWSPFSQTLRDDMFAGGTVYLSVIEDMDFGKFAEAGAEIAAAFEDSRSDIETFSDQGTYSFDWTTPVGRIVIGGDGNNAYTDDSYLLLIDVGGDDNYQGSIGGNKTNVNTVSICVDFDGTDTYGSTTQVASQGGAYMGIAVNWDFIGNDTYTGDAYNQGGAYYGCGILIDSAGDDHYNGDQIAQGAGNWGGCGLLIDEAGSDNYYSFYGSQAFAYTRGSGTLIDMEGDDVYTADDVDIRYPSAQTDQHNSSLSQASAFGWRADPNFLAGGIATLLDLSGNDQYSCGVFGQGAAFMYATAVLKDYGNGNDTFNGVWYVQSATAHMGVSMLWNEAGNDTYTCTMNVSQGGAHHYSHSWFMDLLGDDTYTAPGISLGGGNDVGIGFFLDYDGVDIYHCTSDSSLGGGNYSNTFSKNSYGIFVDDGGDADTYDHTNAGNGTSWSHGAIGGGADGQTT
jgi:hypothetical protein